MVQEKKPDGNAEGQKTSTAPAISLPKGGGAIRGIGEKFAANPVTGTGSMSVPIAASPGRSGFGPQLSLSYDSGAGNGPFGFGWNLSLPSITRKTDKGLPRYHDAEETDVFILSGAEDLVPLLNPDGSRFKDTTTAPGYTIHRYRPRIEGLFARIERWTRADGDVHWRSISKDNILTLYGKDPNSRITDPADHLRVFTWLICDTRDDKGNAVLYEYKPEDGNGVDLDLTRAHERNRGERDDRRRAVNRYLKHIRYGNRVPLLDSAGHRPRLLTVAQIQDAGWMFEVVFDYGEHDDNAPKPGDAGSWTYRSDPFSSYRAGFEVRTGRLCQRVLMFHHFPGEAGVGSDCLVRSTDFTYSRPQDPTRVRNPVYTFLLSVTQSGYKQSNDVYLKSPLPPVEYKYTQAIVQDTVQEVDAASLENLPIGVDGTAYQWTDLHGEGIPGILTEQADAWFYKRNLSPISERPVEFAPLERVATKPNLALAGGQAQFMDLAGDGQPDLVVLDDPMPGLYEHDEEEGWEPFRPFTSRLNRDMRDRNLKFVDLDGDGHADVLISEDDAFVWHASLAEQGFGPARRVQQTLDEEKGPRLVFADGTQSIYLADLSGDGLTDLVRIRNGEVCYWPNLGYGRFGAKVTMDQAPQFDNPDQFDHNRIRLADIDGTGTTDIIYLHRDGVRLYFNQSGNSWSALQPLRVFPRVDDLVSIIPTDLLGNGTACLVWASPLPGDARRQMRYVDLMGGQKPHLLIKTINNLGAETRVEYASSTKFYLRDKYDGKPWITRLPFPVHVVERVETFDAISQNRFVTRYAYHHGYFDGEEREFRGFGMVEQQDTEELAALTGDGTLPAATNLDTVSHVPPVLTKTWFHTGVYVGRENISNFFAGLNDGYDRGEYYREPAWRDDDVEARKRLLDDTVLPPELTLEEEREACRALKGAMLRQEVYALDGTEKAEHPYTITEQNFTIQHLQPRTGNRHAVFFTHAGEAISYHYERNPADPRISHSLVLHVDSFGNMLKTLAIGYGRRAGMSTLLGDDKTKQEQLLITYTENDYTENDMTNPADWVDAHRTPLPCEARTYELTGFGLATGAMRFAFDDFAKDDFAALTLLNEIPYETPVAPAVKRKRLIECVRTRYRRNNLTALLPKGTLQSLALPGESYNLAFTPGLVQAVYIDSGKLPAADVASVLGTAGGYVHSEGDANWWIPSGRMFYSPGSNDTAAQELAYARQYFFLPHRFHDPFGNNTIVEYDKGPNNVEYNLLVALTRDALDNEVRAENDHRVLQPSLVTDPNGNQSDVTFDVLGMVVGTAVMGKPLPSPVEGDSLDGFVADLTEAVILDHLTNPLTDPHAILGRATTRLVYDLFAYKRTKGQPNPQPAVVYTLARETHDADLEPGQQTKVQHSFSYSDGFGREIQKKIQAEPGPHVEGGPVVSPRWVGSGWTIFNNKGKPVRQYEPFFSASHRFEFAKIVGVSPILFYDPVERVVATLHPNHTYEKVVFDPWQQITYDVNDTVVANGTETGDPRTDKDIKGYVAEYFKTQPNTWQTWHQERITEVKGLQEKSAAEKAAKHANTPTTGHLDALGRPFLTIAHNRYERNGAVIEEKSATRVELDIEGNQRAVSDERTKPDGTIEQRIVMRYDYDLLGNRIHQASMEAGERWMLNDVAGTPLYAWDNRGHTFRIEYDPLRRPLRTNVTVPANPDQKLLTERLVYGEQHPEAERNLRGKLYLHLDQAGVVASEAHDFKGNPLRASRRLTNGTQYKQAVDWRLVDADHVALPTDAKALLDPVALATALAPRLEADTYTSRTTYDALNRPLTVISPDGSVYHPTFNEANLLNKVGVNLRGAEAATPFVTNIDYDAKGQRTLIDYGSGATPGRKGATTRYVYDPETFRLIRLTTTRPMNLNGLATQLFKQPTTVQDLHYSYDPVGNITHIADEALPTIFHNNEQVEPVCQYKYDALYRLIEAKGREQINQSAFLFNPPNGNYRDYSFVGAAQLNDPQAARTYTEAYEYDTVGNFEVLRHTATNGNWTRSYDYEEESLIEAGKQNNRLTRTMVGNGFNHIETYTHDAHGNMTAMPHLAAMIWDFEDQLRQVDLGGGGTAYYVYDAAGQRVRKVWEKSASLIEERIYLGGFEIFRRRSGAGAVTLKRESLHVMNEKQRIALAETQTIENGNLVNAPESLQRYHLGNHLGSSTLEVDENADVISYEEYHPYGTTAYQSGRNAAEVKLKRYRYTGMERDKESGLSYHGARYYAPWLCRWVSCDPQFVIDGFNLYQYVRQNPLRYTDPDGHAANLVAGGIGAVLGFGIGFGAALLDDRPVSEALAWGAGAAVLGGVAGLTFGASLAVEGTGLAAVKVTAAKVAVGTALDVTRQKLAIDANRQEKFSYRELAGAALASAAVPVGKEAGELPNLALLAKSAGVVLGSAGVALTSPEAVTAAINGEGRQALSAGFDATLSTLGIAGGWSLGRPTPARAISIGSLGEPLKPFFENLPAVRPRGLNRIDAAPGTRTVTSPEILNDLGLTPNEVNIYVIDEGGNLIVAPQRSAGVSGAKHTELVGGGPAKAAGELRLSRSGTVELNSESGRYIRQSSEAGSAVADALKSWGLDVALKKGPLQ